MLSFLGSPLGALKAPSMPPDLGKLDIRKPDIPRAEGMLIAELRRRTTETARKQGSSQLRALLRAIRVVEEALDKKPRLLAQLTAEFNKWMRECTGDGEKVTAYYASHGGRMRDVVALLGVDGALAAHVNNLFEPAIKGIVPLMNTLVATLRVWMSEESKVPKADDIIRDRLAFAAQHLPPLLELQNKFASLATQIKANEYKWRGIHDSVLEARRAAAATATAAPPPAAAEPTPPAEPAALWEVTKRVKAFGGVEGALELQVGDEVEMLEEDADNEGVGWSRVRVRGEVGLAPRKKLKVKPSVPPPPPPPPPPPAARAPPPSDDDDDDDDMRDGGAGATTITAAAVEAATLKLFDEKGIKDHGDTIDVDDIERELARDSGVRRDSLISLLRHLSAESADGGAPKLHLAEDESDGVGLPDTADGGLSADDDDDDDDATDAEDVAEGDSATQVVA